MKIITLPVSDLHPADYNPRKDLAPGDKQYEKLARSIETFGYVEPIVWNRTTGNIVGGHQRLKVLVQKGYTEVQVVEVELNEQEERILNTPTSKSSSRSGSMLARTHSRATGTTLYLRHLSARAQPESCAPAAISRRATGLASTCIRSPASRLRPGSTQRPSSSNRAKRTLTCLHRSGAAHRTRSAPAQAWLRAAERPQT